MNDSTAVLIGCLGVVLIIFGSIVYLEHQRYTTIESLVESGAKVTEVRCAL